MSCSKEESLRIVKGNTFPLSLDFVTETYSFVFTVTGSPTINTSNQYTMNGVLFFVTSISGSNITMASDTTIPAQIPNTGTLTLVSGTGTASVSYTSRTTNQYLDLTGLTIKFRIITEIVDNPSPSQIILPTVSWGSHTAPTFGKTQYTITSATTSLFPVTALCYGIIEIVDSLGQIFEANDISYIPIAIDNNKL